MYKRPHRALLLAALLPVALVGCVQFGVASAPSPLSPAFESPVAVRVPEGMGSEGLLNLPSGALTSEAALLPVKSDELCFDVKMRTWQGGARRWVAELEVDGRELESREIDLRACTPNSSDPDEPASPHLSCLAVDTALTSLTTDSLDAVKVRGSRLCLPHHGAFGGESREVTLNLRQGAQSYSFRWELDGPNG